MSLRNTPPLAQPNQKKRCPDCLLTQSFSLSLFSFCCFPPHTITLPEMAATTTATSLFSSRLHFQNQNQGYGFPAKTPNSLQVNQIIDGRKMRNATVLSAASTDKAITTAQSVAPTACDRCVSVTSEKRKLC